MSHNNALDNKAYSSIAKTQFASKTIKDINIIPNSQ